MVERPSEPDPTRPTPTRPKVEQPVVKAKSEPKATAKPVKRTFGASVAAARAYALDRLGEQQFGCLDDLVRRESGWRVTASNRSSGAYGLPQALPGRKMAKYGSDWRTNATVQLKWMIAYVNGRYGSACRALQHARSTGWY